MKFEDLCKVVADLIRDDGYFPTPSIVLGTTRVCAAVAVQFMHSARVTSEASTGLPAFLFLSNAAAIRAVYYGTDAKNPPFLTPRVLDILKSVLLSLYNVQLTPMESEQKIMFLNMTRINEGTHIGRSMLERFAAHSNIPVNFMAIAAEQKAPEQVA